MTKAKATRTRVPTDVLELLTDEAEAAGYDSLRCDAAGDSRWSYLKKLLGLAPQFRKALSHPKA